MNWKNDGEAIDKALAWAKKALAELLESKEKEAIAKKHQHAIQHNKIPAIVSFNLDDHIPVMIVRERCERIGFGTILPCGLIRNHAGPCGSHYEEEE